MNNDTKTFLRYLLAQKEIVIFSSHLDDAVLSMGNLLSHLASLQKKVSVVSIFTKGSDLICPHTENLLHQARHTHTTTYFAARKHEDQQALALLGDIRVQHLGFTDAAWRTNKNNKPLYSETTIGRIANDDAPLQTELTNTLRSLISSTKQIAIFAPLAIGQHVDHQLVRNAITEAFPQTLFYTDFPYAEKNDYEEEFITDRELTTIVWHSNENQKKTNAILSYKTQGKSLFDNYKLALGNEIFYVPHTILQKDFVGSNENITTPRQ